MNGHYPGVTNIPRHVAIIMDGNGRWAESRGLDRSYGHVQGVESVRQALKAAIKHGIEYLTIYAFSTENWGRPCSEVDGLMELLCQSVADETPLMLRQGVRMKFIGNTGELSGKVRAAIEKSERETAAGEKVTFVVAVNYSSKWEITDAVRRLAEAAVAGEISPGEITQEMITENLTTKGMPDPDLLIRTSGELRLSNFMLWQLSYSELYFTDIYWPDFGEEDFDRAISDYSKRKRRYGVLMK